ncbi:hypothetical protein GCM10023222_19860 [Saccharopolyspora cebuensis]
MLGTGEVAEHLDVGEARAGELGGELLRGEVLDPAEEAPGALGLDGATGQRWCQVNSALIGSWSDSGSPSSRRNPVRSLA